MDNSIGCQIMLMLLAVAALKGDGESLWIERVVAFLQDEKMICKLYQHAL